MRSLIVFVFALLSVLVSCQVPIPTRPDGFSIGSPAAPVVVDGFFDLLCPDSAAAWPVIKQVIATYGSNLYWIMHTFPLPFHTNAFIANQGLHVVGDAAPKLVWDYTDLLFAKQAKFYNAATANLTINQVIANLASIVDAAKILNRDSFVSGIANSSINWDTRVSWKYGCSRGSVVGTPTFLVNGVFVDADASWTLADWRSMIDPLLQANGISPPATADSRHSKHSTRSALKFTVESPRATNNTCPPNQTPCNYAPNKFECCLAGENCVPNVGCRCLDERFC